MALPDDKLKKQLDAYKAIAAKRPLTNQEFSDFKLLMNKAQGYYSGEDKRQFFKIATTDVFKPQLEHESKQLIIQSNNAMKKADEDILNAQTFAESDAAKALKQQTKINFIDQGLKQKKTMESLNNFIDNSIFVGSVDDPKGGYKQKGEGDPRQMNLRMDEINNNIDNEFPSLLNNYESSNSIKNAVNNNGDSSIGNQRANDIGSGVMDLALSNNSNKSAAENIAGAGVSNMLPANQTKPGTGGGYGYSRSSSSGQQANVYDMTFDENGQPVQYGTMPNTTDPNELRTQIEQDKAKFDQLSQATPFSQAPQNNFNQDIGGTLMDIGRMGLGLQGALQKLPQYQTSPMFNQYMQDAYQKKDMGLSPEEIGFAKNLAERGYGYDVKNIKSLSGGSAGVALGNLGRATGQLQDQYSQLAANDQMMRRQNKQQFYNAANQAENVNQYKFGIDYQNAMMNKQAGAALVQDAMGNLINRNQYNESHGPGSQYYNYMNELNQGMHMDNQILQDSMNQRKIEALAGLKTGIDAKQKQYNELTGSAQNTNQIGLGNTLNGTGGNPVTPQPNGLGNTLDVPLKQENSQGQPLTNFEKRIQNPTLELKNEDGSVSTHSMASAEVDGKQIAYPTVIEKDGKLVRLSDDEAFKYAVDNKEYKEFPTEKEAQAYAEGGYKKGTPLDPNYKGEKNAGEIFGGQKDKPVSLDKASILEMQKSGANVRELVKQTPEYKAEMQTIQDKIAEAEKKKIGANTFTTKVLDDQIKELQKQIDKVDKKHEDRIDKLFDENGKYIG